MCTSARSVNCEKVVRSTAYKDVCYAWIQSINQTKLCRKSKSHADLHESKPVVQPELNKSDLECGGNVTVADHTISYSVEAPHIQTTYLEIIQIPSPGTIPQDEAPQAGSSSAPSAAGNTATACTNDTPKEMLHLNEEDSDDLYAILESIFPGAPDEMKVLLKAQRDALKAPRAQNRRWDQQVDKLQC